VNWRCKHAKWACAERAEAILFGTPPGPNPPGHGDAAGFTHGFMHPLGGLDHVLAMVAVGLYAALLGGRALWLVPATFVTVMALGGAAGLAGYALPYAELGIALSVVVLGVAVALRVSLPTLAATALVGVFAVFHGHAHGAEMPQYLSGYEYAAGFLAATALLHGAGIAAGHGQAQRTWRTPRRGSHRRRGGTRWCGTAGGGALKSISAHARERGHPELKELGPRLRA
jgi:urease accessory protein